MKTIQFGIYETGKTYTDRPGSYGVILNNQNKIGVVKSSGFYFLPGGGVDVGETETDALIREFREETGLEIIVERHLCDANEFQIARDRTLYFNQIGKFFKCVVVKNHHDQSDLSHEFLWVDLDDVSKLFKRKSHQWAASVASQNLDISRNTIINDKKATYRLIKEVELPDLLKLYKHLHKTDKPPENDVLIEKIWESICNNPNILYFVAEIEGKLIGSCHLVVIPNLTRGGKPYGTIENVVTHCDYRSKGVGKGVLQFALSVAWGVECYKVMLMTGSKQDWVHKFYEDAGFQKNVKTAFVINNYS
jgi:8-oxo-dGTP pyrophosphatase MutT (NUDIX family)/GNAT superfamily N-acetyltransferase